jgi:hypothetical protein
MIKEIYTAHSQAICWEKRYSTLKICFALLTLIALENAEIMSAGSQHLMKLKLYNDQRNAKVFKSFIY